jgi:hypothetical protein
MLVKEKERGGEERKLTLEVERVLALALGKAVLLGHGDGEQQQSSDRKP